MPRRMKDEWRLPSRMWTFTDREAVLVLAPIFKGWQQWLSEARGRLELAQQAGADAQVLAVAQAAVNELLTAMTEAADGRPQ